MAVSSDMAYIIPRVYSLRFCVNVHSILGDAARRKRKWVFLAEYSVIHLVQYHIHSDTSPRCVN